MLISRQLTRRTAKTAARQACTAVSSGACSVWAGAPAHWSSGQADSTSAACPARLGDPSASISPGLQKKALETLVLWVSSENQTKWGKGRWEHFKPSSLAGGLPGSSWAGGGFPSIPLGMRQRQLPSMGRKTDNLPQGERQADRHTQPSTHHPDFSVLRYYFFLSIFKVILSFCSHLVLVLHTYHARPAAVKDQDEITLFFK